MKLFVLLLSASLLFKKENKIKLISPYGNGGVNLFIKQNGVFKNIGYVNITPYNVSLDYKIDGEYYVVKDAYFRKSEVDKLILKGIYKVS